MPEQHEPVLSLNTFIVRFWCEMGSEPGRWHGHVHHIQSGEQAAFSDEAVLRQFICQWVQIAQEAAGLPQAANLREAEQREEI